jgi:hypothetical protein
VKVRTGRKISLKRRKACMEMRMMEGYAQWWWFWGKGLGAGKERGKHKAHLLNLIY